MARPRSFPPPRPQRAEAGMQAAGRLPTGHMNRLEAEYCAHLERERAAGRIRWFAFEATTFVLPGRVRYTPDFLVLGADGLLEAHEVKGGLFTDDAKVKIRVAAGHFPVRFVLMRARTKKDGGGWLRVPYGEDASTTDAWSPLA